MQNFERSTVLHKDAYTELHRFSKQSTGGRDPIFIFPPFAGRSGNVTQNLIDALVADGRSVYAYMLKSATLETADLNMEMLIKKLLDYQNMFVGSPIELVGTCQGGWLASIYAALFPYRVSRLSTFAAPIDTNTGKDNVIERYCKSSNIDVHKLFVQMNGGIQPGWAQWLSFAISAPYEVFVGKYAKLATALIRDDSAAVAKWNKNDAWYNEPFNLAGPWFLDALENHFFNNKLYKGKWCLFGEYIDLTDIDCPVHVYSGANDDITHPAQAFGLVELVENLVPTTYKCFEGAGHTKVFTGKDEIKYFIEETR